MTITALPLDTVLALGRADELGAPFGAPVVFVDLDVDREASALAELSTLLGPAPVIVVGVADGPIDIDPLAFDVLVCASGPAPRPWVTGDPEDLAAAVAASPSAAVTAVQLLRTAEVAEVADAVVAESWVYSLLQSGTEHRAWLAARESLDRRARPDHAVLVEREGDRLRVVLDRPEVRNAYGTRMRDELCDALALVEADPSIVTVELTGNGPVFCSGGDLDEFGTAPAPVPAHLVRTARNAGVMLARVADRVTVHVHGRCVGAGVELPAFAGTVIAAPDTTFRLPEVAMGLVPGAGGTASIPRRIGRHRCAWMAITGTELEVETAREWGLVDRIEDAR